MALFVSEMRYRLLLPDYRCAEQSFRHQFGAKLKLKNYNKVRKGKNVWDKSRDFGLVSLAS
jgi:hypothetical protein